jgi:hypothetical protein
MHEETKMGFWIELEAHLYLIMPKIERQCRFKVKLNDYRMILHKIKSGDLIRLLISQFDLIMGLIKGLIKFRN